MIRYRSSTPPTYSSFTMNLPHQIQQDLEKWVKVQGISVEEFILEAVVEKLTRLNQQGGASPIQSNPEAVEVTSTSPRLRRKDGILVIDVEPITAFDTNTFIDQLREERIQEQMAL